MDTIRECLNDPAEVHAAWFGFLEAFGLFMVELLTPEARGELWEELHYFWAGLVVGVIAQAIILWALCYAALHSVFAQTFETSFALGGLAGCVLAGTWLFVALPEKEWSFRVVHLWDIGGLGPNDPLLDRAGHRTRIIISRLERERER